MNIYSPARSQPAGVPYPARGSTLKLVLGAIDWMTAKLGRTPMVPQHLELGVRGEDAALFDLRRLGWIVVARRWRSYRHRGDLDLIAWDGATLCFVEVKTRSSHAVAEAEASVDHDKRRTLRRLAWHYLRYLPPPEASRFDVLSVYFERGKAAEYRLFRGAFDWAD